MKSRLSPLKSSKTQKQLFFHPNQSNYQKPILLPSKKKKQETDLYTKLRRRATYANLPSKQVFGSKLSRRKRPFF